jgi:membrane protease YdiL (CAAX protease family)
LIVPVPSIGVLSGLILFPNSSLGAVAFAVCKIWMLCLPAGWTWLVDREPIRFPLPNRDGFGMGLLSGACLSLAAIGADFMIGDALVDRKALALGLTEIGLGSPATYIAAAAYWVLVNSLIEEYAWRWFCVKQCQRLMPQIGAIAAAALFFTLHHIIAIQAFVSWSAVWLCSLGVFLGGVVWSAMYVRYRSIWPGYLSHAIVDLTIFTILAYMLF